MRDPQRIPLMLAKLQEYWMKYPDMRLGQIVEVIRHRAGNKCDDSFYVEDDDMDKALSEMLRNG